MSAKVMYMPEGDQVVLVYDLFTHHTEVISTIGIDTLMTTEWYQKIANGVEGPNGSMLLDDKFVKKHFVEIGEFE